MSGRFGAAIVAFALAAAIATHAPLLPEFLVQLRDPNLLGGPVMNALLHSFGYAFVVALCGALSGCAVLLAAWRARMRGAGEWHATLAAALCALAMSGRAGVALDPIGWLCAAACCLLLEREDDRSALGLTAVVALWSLLQGGATLGSLMILCTLAGMLADRGFDESVRSRIVAWLPAFLFGVLQLHAAPWHAYGAHALYLDAMIGGAQRDRLWSGNVSAPALGFSAIVIVAAWYGLRRRGRMADAFAFCALLLLTLADARMLPYFGIVGAPIAVDALASYYVIVRSKPRGSVVRYSPAVLAACAAFTAVVAAPEPKATIWPPAFGQGPAIVGYLQTRHAPLHVLCTKPRWCDGLTDIVPRTRTIADDRFGITPAHRLAVQAAVANASPQWHRYVRADRIDTIIASEEDGIVALASQRGWHVRAADNEQVVLQP